jgi:hypothetical protein
MVGHEDIRLLRVKTIAAFNLYWDEQQPQDDASPQAGRVISPEMAEAQGGTHDDATADNHRFDNDEW